MPDMFIELLQERWDLETKLYKLSQSIEEFSDEFTRAFNDVSDQQYSLLEKQESCMLEYLKVLEERIKLFRMEH